MEQFTYLADPSRSLRMYNSAYLDQVEQAERRIARYLEKLTRVRSR